MSPALTTGVLDPRGPVAANTYQLLQNATVVMLALIVPIIVLTLVFAWWFRAGNRRAKRRLDWSYSGALEVVNWMVPLMIVLFLGGTGWVASHALDPAKPLPSQAPPLRIQVVSLDWKWLFIYPDAGVAAVNHLVVPAGRVLHLQLTSGSVMNSFFVPQLGSQIYTMAGMTTTLYLQADRPGTFPGRSVQFSGDGFSDMHFNVDAVPASDYDAWLARTRASGTRLDAGAYSALSRPGTSVPRDYQLDAPRLFQTILAASMSSSSSSPH